MESSASASTTGPVATAGVLSAAIESAPSGLVHAAAESAQVEDPDVPTFGIPVLGAVALPMVDGDAMDALDSSPVDVEKETSPKESSSSQVHDEANGSVAATDTAARHGTAAANDGDGETGGNDTNNDNDNEDDENDVDHDYDGMEELTEEEEKSAMLNIILSELMRKFREENGRGPTSQEVLEIRASVAEQLEMEVATTESIEKFNNAAAAAATAATSNQPSDPQHQAGDDRKRPAETNGSENDDDENNSSSNQPALKRVKFHSSVVSPTQAEESIVAEQLLNQQPETSP
jgi:hypothetical protein